MSQIKKWNGICLKLLVTKKLQGFDVKRNSLSTTLVVKKKVIKIQYFFPQMLTTTLTQSDKTKYLFFTLKKTDIEFRLTNNIIEMIMWHSDIL